VRRLDVGHFQVLESVAESIWAPKLTGLAGFMDSRIHGLSLQLSEFQGVELPSFQLGRGEQIPCPNLLRFQ